MAGNNFYQEKPFLNNEKVIKLIPKFPINVTSGLFLNTILAFNEKYYNYGLARNQARLKEEKIMLPVDKNKNIDWQFMEKYIINRTKFLFERIKFN